MVAVKNRSRFEMFERLGFFVEILVAQVPKKESCTKPKQKTGKVVAKSKKKQGTSKKTHRKFGALFLNLHVSIGRRRRAVQMAFSML